MEEDGPTRRSLSAKALALAIRGRCLGVVKFLLWAGARTDYEENISKRTVLHMACEKDDRMELIVCELLKYTVDVNAKDIKGRTPLHEASRRGNQRVAQALVCNGAKTSVADKSGTTPLHEVLIHCDDTKLGFFLITLLENSTRFGGSEEWPSEDEEIKLKLIAQDDKGETALHLASTRNDADLVKHFLEMGAQVGVNNVGGMTALHSAAMACAGDVIHVLVDNGADVNAKDKNGNTPLHFACSTNYYKDTYYCRSTASRTNTIENLLSRGALVYEKNQRMKTPYEELEECYSSANPSLEVKTKIEEMFMKHVTVLRSLNIQDAFDFEWLFGTDYSDKFINECCRELEDMKSNIIMKSISLLEVLSHTVQPSLLPPDDLQHINEFILCSDLLNRYPLYGPSLRTFFQRVKKLSLEEVDEKEASLSIGTTTDNLDE